MKTTFRFPQKTAYLLFSFFFFISCSKFDNVSVSNMNFDDEVQLAKNLVFTYDKDLVRESDLNTWEAET